MSFCYIFFRENVFAFSNQDEKWCFTKKENFICINELKTNIELVLNMIHFCMSTWKIF